MAEKKRITGRVFFAQSSEYDSCVLEITNDGVSLEIEGQATEQVCQVRDLKIEPRLGSIAQKLTFPDGRVFETQDLAAIEEIKPGGFWNNVAKAEKTGWHLLPMAIATPFLAFGLYKLMIPVLISMGMAVTPDQALYTIDKSTMTTLETVMLDKTELPETRQQEVTDIFNRLLAAKEEKGALSNRDFRYRLLFREANRVGPNAFALPGGTIVITDELVTDFGDDSILAAVLAHEIGHVDSEHQLRQLFRALGMWFMITMIAGDSGEILEDALLEGSALLSLSYSRTHEMGADDYSYELLKEAGLPTDGLIHFFDKLAKEYPMPKKGEWAMSHPIGDNRIENIIEKIIADGGTPPERNLDDEPDSKDDSPEKEE